jgi:transposase
MAQYVGIDVSKDTVEVGVMDDGGNAPNAPRANHESGYAKLASWLKNRRAQGSAVCLEATGRYSEGVAEVLYAAG